MTDSATMDRRSVPRIGVQDYFAREMPGWAYHGHVSVKDGKVSLRTGFMLTGHHPYDGETPAQQVDNAIEDLVVSGRILEVNASGLGREAWWEAYRRNHEMTRVEDISSPEGETLVHVLSREK